MALLDTLGVQKEPCMRLPIGLMALMLCSAAGAQGQPSCVPAGSVQLHPQSAREGWLSKLGVGEARQFVGKAAGAGQWEGTTLYLMCAIQGPAQRMKAVDVSGEGRGVPAAGDRRSLSGLARRTGHTQQEADVLAGKYERLAGALFRLVPDEEGSIVGEDEVILRKHKRRFGLDEAAESQEGAVEMSEAPASALEAKIEAAQARGDLKEVMRLAMQANAAAEPAKAQAKQASAKIERALWQALESAYPELAQAAYRSIITFGANPCLRCTVPAPQAR